MSRLRSNSGGSDGGGRKHGSAWADPFKNPTAQDDSDLAAMRARAMEALGVTPPSRPGRLRRSGSFGSLKTGTKRKLEPLHWDGKRPTTTSASQSAKLRTREYAGLVNQASTCYLNSLLQTLFMTPELRSVLYAWEWDEERDTEDCIPYQLQVLFGLLQLTRRSTITTTALTASFGWTDAQAFVQQDVQELCRVLFNTLSETFQGTPNAGVIDKLYQGGLHDFLHCHKCGTERVRKDAFSDLSLVVKPFGATKCIGSVVEALRLYMTKETLTAPNQYFCNVCQAKVDCDKGLKVSHFPRILSLQLNRFAFDYETMRRTKLNNHVHFPMFLDLNPMLGVAFEPQPSVDDTPVPAPSPTANAAPAPTNSDTVPGPPGGDDGDNEDAAADADASRVDEPGGGASNPHVAPADAGGDGKGGDIDGTASKEEEDASPPVESKPVVLTRDDFGPSVSVKQLQACSTLSSVEQMLSRGPDVFELFSVMVHAGGATSGHYYAYIKNLDTGMWFKFNDSTVTPASIADVNSAQGDGASSANAYMLMYRRVTPGAAQAFPPAEAVPSYVQQKVREENEKARKLAEAARIRSLTYTLKVKYGSNTLSVPMLKTLTMFEATVKAWTAHGLSGAPEAVVEAAKTQPLALGASAPPPPPPGDSDIDGDSGSAEGGAAAQVEGREGEDQKGAGAARTRTGADGDGTTPTGVAADGGGGGTDTDGGAPGETGSTTPQTLPDILVGCVAVVPLDRVRLRRYNPHTKTDQMPYSNASELTLEQLDIYDHFSMRLEEREEGVPFPEWDPNAITVRIIRYDPETDSFRDEVKVSVGKSITLSTFHRILEGHNDLGHIPAESQRLMKMFGAIGRARANIIEGDNKQLHDGLKIYQNSKLYLEPIPDPTEPDTHASPTTPSEEPGGAAPTTTEEATLGDADGKSTAATSSGHTAGRRPSSNRTLAMLNKRRAGKVKPVTRIPMGVTTKTSPAMRAFERDMNAMKVKYNGIGEPESSRCITVDKRGTLHTLRLKIATALSVAPTSIRLRLNRGGRIFRNYGIKLAYVFTNDDPSVHVEEGRTLSSGEFLCQFHIRHTTRSTSFPGACAAIATETGSAAPSGIDCTLAPIAHPTMTTWRQVLPRVAPGSASSGASPGPAGGGPDADATAGGTASADGPADAVGVSTQDAGADSPATDSPATDSPATDSPATAPAGTPTSGGATETATLPGEAPSSAPAASTTNTTVSLPVSVKMQVSDLRRQLHALLQLNGAVSPDVTVAHLRVRAKVGDDLGAVLLDGLTVKECLGFVNDKTKLVVQVLPSAEILPPDARILRLQWFDRGSWTCGPTTEVMVTRSTRIMDIGAHVAAACGLRVEDVRLFRPVGVFNLLSVVNVTWCKADTDERHISAQPWHCADGDKVILTDFSVPLLKLSDDERALRAPKRSTGRAWARTRPSSRDTSRGVTIKTKKQRDAEAQAKRQARIDAGLPPEEEKVTRAEVPKVAPVSRDQDDSSGSKGVRGVARLREINELAEERLLARDLAAAMGEDVDDEEPDFDPVGGDAGDLLAMAAMSDSDSDSDDSDSD